MFRGNKILSAWNAKGKRFCFVLDFFCGTFWYDTSQYLILAINKIPKLNSAGKLLVGIRL